MNSKAVIALAVVTILIGVGVAIVLHNNADSPTPAKADALRTDLQVGDYIGCEMKSSSSTENSLQMSSVQFFEPIYPKSGMSYPIIGEKTLSYKGNDILCQVYGTLKEGFGNGVGYYMNNGVCYGKATGYGDCFVETLLIDTNLDLTKAKDQQLIKGGEFVKTSTYAKDSIVTVLNTVKSYDYKVEIWNVKNIKTTEKPASDSDKMTVRGINHGTISVETESSGMTEMSKVAFLSPVSYSNLIKSLEEKGLQYRIQSRDSKIIDTVYGERQTDVRAVMFDDCGGSVTMTVYYIGDIIYQSDIFIDKITSSSTVLFKLTSTSLITPANE